MPRLRVPGAIVRAMPKGLALVELLAACTVLAVGLLAVARLTGEAARLATEARVEARAVDRADSVLAAAALRPCADTVGGAFTRVDFDRRLRTVRVDIAPAVVLEATVPCRR